MRRFETKRLKIDTALAILDNFRWFGWYCKVTPTGCGYALVRCHVWAWSFFVLTKEDLV